MTRTYKATGINLKSVPIGEADRLLTILTQEYGLIKVVAPGVRKHRSTLGGRSGLFVVNELLIAKGRSLDKITQAETLEAYTGLSQDLGKLTAGQYLAELTLTQALSHQPQEELFCLLREHLSRLERLPAPMEPNFPTPLLAYLNQGIFHLLALAGIAPQVQQCCLTRRPLTPNFASPTWRVEFSISDGGTVSPTDFANLEAEKEKRDTQTLGVEVLSPPRKRRHPPPTPITAGELTILQQLGQPQLTGPVALCQPQAWVTVEHLLRRYAEYHLDCSIRSATLIDTYLQTFDLL